MVSILDKVRNDIYKNIRNIYVILIATSCYIKNNIFNIMYMIL